MRKFLHAPRRNLLGKGEGRGGVSIFCEAALEMYIGGSRWSLGQDGLMVLPPPAPCLPIPRGPHFRHNLVVQHPYLRSCRRPMKQCACHEHDLPEVNSHELILSSVLRSAAVDTATQSTNQCHKQSSWK